jgi:ribosome-binding protein aMBF1 (putative translation factor)
MNSTSVNYQDWEPVVFTKKPQELKKKESIQKPPGNKEMIRLMEDDIPKLNKMSREYAQAIVDGRTAMGFSQKDLAQRLSVKDNVIKEYENCQVTNFNMGFLKKILRILKVDPKTVIKNN